MNGSRFDRVVKAFAFGTSRRRLMAGLAGAAAGGTRLRVSIAAQTFEASEEDLAYIADRSSCLKNQLQELQSAVKQLPFDNPTGFDPRLDRFIEDLLVLTEHGAEATTWDGVRLNDFINTISLIPGAVSMGATADVYLYDFVLQNPNTGEQETPPANTVCSSPPPAGGTPADEICVPAEAPTNPSGKCAPTSGPRPKTCAASCLDVWQCRQNAALASGNVSALTDAFARFVECFLYWKKADTANICLAHLIDLGCMLQITCSCGGDCR